MESLQILITNRQLKGRAGTELYVRDLAVKLLNLGHVPIVYSPRLGAVAEEIRGKGIQVTDNFAEISVQPDVIHGHHNAETLSALLHFPNVPAMFFVHDSRADHDVPLVFPRVLRYVAVDYLCLERITSETRIPANRACVVFNSVDLDLFKPRSPLPEHPQKALVFSNYSNSFLNPVKEACARRGLSLDVIGEASGNPTDHPEKILRDYDIVFAKARCAIEAMAVGAAVVLCDFPGAGPMVTSADFDRLRQYNFGRRVLDRTIISEKIAQEIDRYDPLDATKVSQRIRDKAGLDSMVDQIINIYRDVIGEGKQIEKTDEEAEGRSAAEFVRWLSLKMDDQEQIYRNSTWYLLREKVANVFLIGRLAKGAARLLAGKRPSN